jgi:metal-dependent amidase/aminoacylase/carboxypeptidase family protein
MTKEVEVEGGVFKPTEMMTKLRNPFKKKKISPTEPSSNREETIYEIQIKYTKIENGKINENKDEDEIYLSLYIRNTEDEDEDKLKKEFKKNLNVIANISTIKKLEKELKIENNKIYLLVNINLDLKKIKDEKIKNRIINIVKTRMVNVKNLILKKKSTSPPAPPSPLSEPDAPLPADPVASSSSSSKAAEAAAQAATDAKPPAQAQVYESDPDSDAGNGATSRSV